MYVIGTAGHVDHGKSTLVKALTGIDPDRLKEEREREMTIDLGFAWLQLPNVEEVGVVDVPGHERFVKNMLAGVGGIDLAMLIVAADEGVMPQTREHLAILDLLRVKKVIAVITKKDLVDADFLELVTGDVEQLLKGTALEGSTVVAMSSLTGDGLPELKATLVDALKQTPQRKDVGAPRLPIDRAFIMTGFGPVVTGTLIDGSFQVGQEVEIVPAGLKARIRGLQSHRKKLETATPGRRLAVNLSGVNYEDLHRGQVLATPGVLVSTTAFDAHLRMVGDTAVSLKHGASVIFHCGTFESPAKVRLLDADELGTGDTGWAQIKPDVPAPTVKGDPFILRDSHGTLAGGGIVELKAKRHRRFEESLLEHLGILEEGTSEDVVLEALASTEPSQTKALAAATNLGVNEVRAAIVKLVEAKRIVTLGDRSDSPVLTSGGFQRLRERAIAILADMHQNFPLRKGIVKEELRSKLELPAPAFALLLQAFVAGGEIVEEGPAIRLASHKPGLNEAAAKQAEQYLRALNANRYSPASDRSVDPEIVTYLADQGEIVKASSEVYFSTQAYQEMVAKIRALAKEKGSFTVAQARDIFGNSRKYMLALLEYMDQQRLTRRVGDERTMRQP